MAPYPHPREQGTTPDTTDGVTLGACFTPEELTRLCALRRRFQDHPDHGDTDAALRRLEFARWLAQNGRLNEGVKAESADMQQPAA
jgi:hypothetical protein